MSKANSELTQITDRMTHNIYIYMYVYLFSLILLEL